MKLLMGTKKADKPQVKMYLTDEEVQTLEKAAADFGRSSKQEVLHELLTIYLPVWKAVQTSHRRAVDHQVKQILSESGVVVPLASDGDIVGDGSIAIQPEANKKKG